MNKIVKVEANEVSIGTSGGELIKVDRSKINFFPEIGDQVEIFGSGADVVVNKVGGANPNKHNSKNKPLTIPLIFSWIVAV